MFLSVSKHREPPMETSGMLMQVGRTQNSTSWASLFWVASTHHFGLMSGFNYRTVYRPNIHCCSHCTTKWKMFASTRRQLRSTERISRTSGGKFFFVHASILHKSVQSSGLSLCSCKRSLYPLPWPCKDTPRLYTDTIMHCLLPTNLQLYFLGTRTVIAH